MKQLTLITILLLAVPSRANQAASELRVTTEDTSGARLPGVTITISGPVEREAKTGPQGDVYFKALPPGDYHVTARLLGFTDATVTLILEEGRVAEHILEMRIGSLDQVLPGYSKPVREMIVTGCGAAPEDLASLWRAVNAVAHVRILSQRPDDHLPGVPKAQSQVVTWNQVRVIETFKHHRSWPRQTGLVEVAQAGGAIDRGPFIQLVRHSPLLTVGTEYVLFVLHTEWYRGWSVAFCAQGAYAVDKGTVEPHGEGDVPRQWRGRSTVDFIAALRSLTR